MAKNGEDSKVITLTLSPMFAALLEQVHRQHKIDSNVFNETVLALDPGETTGVAEFDGDCTIHVYQKATKDLGQSGDWLQELLTYSPLIDGYLKHLRVEDYRVYEWKAQDHAWSPVHTIQWLGVIKYVAHTRDIEPTFAMASVAKKFWTDEKLDHFGLNPKGLRHGRDALRHLLYFLLFPTKA